MEELDEPLVAEILAQETDACMRTVGAAALVVEECGDGHGDADAVRDGEGIEQLEAEPGLEADAAAEIGLEDALAVDDLGEEPEVVRLGDGGVGRTVRETDFQLAGEPVGEVEGVEGVGKSLCVRNDVENRIFVKTRIGAHERVAEGVAAAAAEAEADRLAGRERGGDLSGRNTVELNVLACGQVGVVAAVGPEDVRGVTEIVRRDASAHTPDAHHRLVIALLIDAEACGTALERLGVEATGDVVRPRLDERFLKILHDRSFLLQI